MVQTIGIMIGGYIIFRCIEIACRNRSQFGSRGQQIFVVVMALIGILATGPMTVDLIEKSIPETLLK